jgi:hypothetical protein
MLIQLMRVCYYLCWWYFMACLQISKQDLCCFSCLVNCRKPFKFQPVLILYWLIHSFVVQRYGVWADWDNPYLTLSPEYEAAQVFSLLPTFTKYVNNEYAILCISHKWEPEDLLHSSCPVNISIFSITLDYTLYFSDDEHVSFQSDDEHVSFHFLC